MHLDSARTIIGDKIIVNIFHNIKNAYFELDFLKSTASQRYLLMKLSQKMVGQVADLLGRTPRGLKAVAVVNGQGEPSVIRVSSVVDQKPFPTLFWLIDRTLCYQIDQLEASGLIKKLQEQVDTNISIRESMVRDHNAHIKLRNDYFTENERTYLKITGYFDVLKARGIGGISNPTRIRCLHSWYAAHMVVQNTIGQLLDQYLQTFVSK